MTVAAITMVKDEADIVGTTVARMAVEADFVLVYDNGSTDGTRDILEAVDGDVTIWDDPEPGYFQSAKMTHLAHVAGQRGALWVVPFDADELWTSHLGRLADVLRGCVTRHWAAASAQVFDHMATGLDEGDGPVERMVYRRRDPLPLPKVAARYDHSIVIHQGNHGVSYGDLALGAFEGLMTVHHYPYRSVEQFIRKVRNGARAYAATGDALRSDIGAHWRQWGTWDDDALAELFRTWYYREDPHAYLRIGDEYLPPLERDPVLAS